MKKIAWFGTHPIQYHSPMFTYISKEKTIAQTVYYFSDFSIKGYQDKEFGKEIKWDIPLLEGYKSKILKNYTKKEHGSFFSYINLDIYKEIKSNNYDLVIAHGWNTFSHILLFISCILTSTPYALRGDTNALGESERRGFKQRLRRIFLKTLFKKSSAVFYIGVQNKKFYQYYSVSEQKLYKMPFAVNNDYFRQYKSKIDIDKEKKKYNISNDETVILYSGKLIALKQIDILIKALAKTTSKYTLLIVGDGEERQVLEDLSLQLNVNSNFLGFVNQNEIPKYYWLSDIFVMSSHQEAWGLSINEAMCCECAVIVSDSVGAKDDLVKKNGFVFKTGDVNDLAAKLNVLMSDSKLLEQCKRNSLNIIKDYSYEKDYEAIKKILSLK